MRPRFLLITVVLATTVIAAATAAAFAQSPLSPRIGGTGVGDNNPSVTGSGVRNNPGAGANASIDNEQTASAPPIRDSGSAIEFTLPLPAGNVAPQLGTPPSADVRKR